MTSCRSTTERGQIYLWSHKVRFSNKKCVFLNQFDLRIPKMAFLSQCELYICSKLQFEKWRHKRIQFLGYMFFENWYINLKFGVSDVQVWLQKMYFDFCEIWWKILILTKNYIFFNFREWSEKLFLGKSRAAIWTRSFLSLFWYF